MWAFLVGKSHPMLLKGWLRDAGNHISVIHHYPPYLPLFVTIHNHLPLFKTICTIRDYSQPFATIRDYLHYSWLFTTICHYSRLFALFILFAIHYSWLFAICHSSFPDPHIYVSCEYLARCHHCRWWFCLFSSPFCLTMYWWL